ncbi:wax ester synthase/diacylglycerol acyltransferase 5-like [Magnolia sinica]|uniref:wax ester synthase/diacylglycerol acyltransferase 5-like n=1 Tax=Magnolia sinica TaxID=86752 RepID=UPI002658FAC6|nr:wax ester synthase/diacylglycerol acyltransferase 5-like [Magnolia sinica]
MASNQSRDVLLEDNHDFLPASPTSEYINSSVLSLSILGVFEIETPIDDSPTIELLREQFLPINNRFSSILIRDGNGAQRWKKVDIRLEDHVKVPHFPTGLPPATYDEYLQEYLSKIALDRLPENRPLWEIHLIKYPTSDAAGTVVFKLHHALGDGFSLMGALFSCLKRADDPSLPLTFPTYSTKSTTSSTSHRMSDTCKKVSTIAAGCWYTASDFVQSVLHSTVLQDDHTAIRSGTPLVEFEPVTISSVTFSLDRIREIKSKISGTVNDVAVGIIFYAIQLYQQRMGQISPGRRMTALVLLNTRMVNGYQCVEDMLKEKTWGNHFTFLQIAIPSSDNAEKENPLAFLLKAKKTIKRKRHSLAVYLNGRLVQMLRTIRGPEAASRYIHATMKNTTTGISYLVGPMEKMEMGDLPVKSFYFSVVGVPQSLALTMVSYMGNLRVVASAEKRFINSQLLMSCMKEAYDKVHREACGVDGTESQ